jgi:hypothetical protein
MCFRPFPMALGSRMPDLDPFEVFLPIAEIRSFDGTARELGSMLG